jgi:exoribonuclease R
LFNKYYNNTTIENAFTIDRQGTEHFDDAISIVENEKIEVNVYITDLCIWFQEYNLWDLLQNAGGFIEINGQ